MSLKRSVEQSDTRAGRLFDTVIYALIVVSREAMIDSAFFDRFHAYIPGWEIPKMRPEFFTKRNGLSAFLSREGVPSYPTARSTLAYFTPSRRVAVGT